MLKSRKIGLSTIESLFFGRLCSLWCLWRCLRLRSRSIMLLFVQVSAISQKQRKEQPHAQCHVEYRSEVFTNFMQLVY